ncbi:MAG: ribonuclease R [Candidatus Pacebacteria bacterium]|nr:ribonuclease R [Candidatus Paceibacterota bacterium]MBP9866534.1 ribonuclease R [Candidatus Paceibacterota bacterium]
MQKLFIGSISLTSKKDGYVRVSELENEGAIFVDHSHLHTALSGDTVEVELLGKKKNIKGEDELYGSVSKVIERGRKGYAGILEEENGMVFLVPDDKRMYTDVIIPNNARLDSEIGQKVIVTITNWTDAQKSPIGAVTAILGKPGDNNAEMLAYALERGFSDVHTKEVNEEADAIKIRGILDEDKQGRRDFRNVPTFTIDPIDAKDFDDAISFKKLDNGHYEVGVHIADVSYYVRPGMALDEEAIARETSVYLVDRCIPMLPEVLSNDLCSLVQGEDRLVMSCVLELDDDGVVYNEWYGRSLINSHRRYSYEDAQSTLDTKQGDFYEELSILNTIAKKLLKARFDNGALSLETEEVKFKLDEKGVPIDVYIKSRGDTHKMIEEYMLLANKYVSKFITKKQEEKNGEGKGICVYRIHDKPDPDRMHDLDLYIKGLGYTVRFMDGLIPSKDLNDLLIKMGDRPEKALLQVHITRAMAKAIYSTKNVGHYGLAFDYYSHFTSPIRRYPDVLTHRLLMRVIEGDYPLESERGLYEKLCMQASRREKEASDAERGSIKYKQVEYMSYRIGQEFDGMVSGVSEWGIFVEEKKSKCEGMIRLRDLGGDDFYNYDQKGGRVFGEKTGVEYKIGTPVKIKVKNANLELRMIDYILVF